MKELFLLLCYLFLPVFLLVFLLLVELSLLLPHRAHEFILEDDHFLLFSVYRLVPLIISFWGPK